MRLAHLTWWIVASAIAAAENVTVGLCAIVKDAEPYLVEWRDAVRDNDRDNDRAAAAASPRPF